MTLGLIEHASTETLVCSPSPRREPILTSTSGTCGHLFCSYSESGAWGKRDAVAEKKRGSWRVWDEDQRGLPVYGAMQGKGLLGAMEA